MVGLGGLPQIHSPATAMSTTTVSDTVSAKALAKAHAQAIAAEKAKELTRELGERYVDQEYDKELRKCGMSWLRYSKESCEGYVRDYDMGKEPTAVAAVEIRARELVFGINKDRDVEEVEGHIPYLIYCTMKRLLREAKEVVGPLLQAECSRFVKANRKYAERLLGGVDMQLYIMPQSLYNEARDDLQRQYEGGGFRPDDIFRHATNALRAAASPAELRKVLMGEIGERYVDAEHDKTLCEAARRWRDFDRMSCVGYIEDFVAGDVRPRASGSMEKRVKELFVGLHDSEVEIHAQYVIYRTLDRVLMESARVGVVGPLLREECLRAVEEDEKRVREYLAWVEDEMLRDPPLGLYEEILEGDEEIKIRVPPLAIYENAKDDLMRGYDYGPGQEPSPKEICEHSVKALKAALAKARKEFIKTLDGKYGDSKHDQKLWEAAEKWARYNAQSCKEYLKDFATGEETECTQRTKKRALELAHESPLKVAVENHAYYLVYRTLSKIMGGVCEAVWKSFYAECVRALEEEMEGVKDFLDWFDEKEHRLRTVLPPLSIYEKAKADLEWDGREPSADEIYHHSATALNAAIARTEAAKRATEEAEKAKEEAEKAKEEAEKAKKEAEEVREELIETLNEKYGDDFEAEYDKKLRTEARKWRDRDLASCEEFMQSFERGEVPESTRQMETRALELIVESPLNKGIDAVDLEIDVYYLIYRVMNRVLRQVPEKVGRFLREECERAIRDEREAVDEFLKLYEESENNFYGMTDPPMPPGSIFEHAKGNLMERYWYGRDKSPSADDICRHSAEALKFTLSTTAANRKRKFDRD